MKQVRSATEAWVSLAFSEDDLMIGADAVVGLPDNSTVVEYDLDSKVMRIVVLAHLFLVHKFFFFEGP